MSALDATLAALGVTGGVAAVIQLRLWHRNWSDSRIDHFGAVERHAMRLLQQIEAEGFRPDFVLGIGRSGAFVGGWLAGNLGSVSIEVVDRMHQTDSSQAVEFPNIDQRISLLKTLYGERAKVLIVEGAATRGNTFIAFEKVRREHANSWDCKYAVLYEADTNISHLDFAAKRLDRTPERYPWHKTAGYRSFLRSSEPRRRR